MIVLGRDAFKHPIVGCCGNVRNDLIYPIGYNSDFERFKKNAIRSMKNYGGEETYSNVCRNDTFLIEQYEAEGLEEQRGKGKPIFELRLSGDLWHYYEHGIELFSVKTVEELIEKWK